jgi:hypothetical protein
MSHGQTYPGGSDPLFSMYFCTATVFNLIPASFASALPIEYAFLAPIHALFIVRVLVAHATRGVSARST